MTPAEAFVLETTTPRPVPFVPEVLLYQAGEALELWERTEVRAGTTGLPPPFWAFAWAGGQALARFVLDHAALITGRHVLDLAAGSGLVAVAAMKAGAASAVGNEVDELAVAAIGLNAAANDVAVIPLLSDLTADISALDTLPAPTVVLAGDVFYDRAMSALVLPLLHRWAGDGALVLVGDPGRAYLPGDGLEPLARYDVPVMRSLEDRDVRATAVLRVKPI